EIVNELGHALGGRAHALEIVLAIGIQRLGVVFQQRQAESIYAAEWGAQVVGDRVTESFQFLVRGFELEGMLLELMIELLYLFFGPLAASDVGGKTAERIGLTGSVTQGKHDQNIGQWFLLTGGHDLDRDRAWSLHYLAVVGAKLLGERGGKD